MNTTPLLDLLSHTAMKGAAVLLLALLLGLMLRRLAAARRYALWVTAIAALAVLPVAMWLLPPWHVLPKAEEMNRPVMEPPQFSVDAEQGLPAESNGVPLPAAASTLPLPVQASTPSVFLWNIQWQDVVSTLPGVWILITGLLLLRLGQSAWHLHRLGASLHPGECPMLEQAARELGLKRLPQLLIGPGDSVPMVWGGAETPPASA